LSGRQKITLTLSQRPHPAAPRARLRSPHIEVPHDGLRNAAVSHEGHNMRMHLGRCASGQVLHAGAQGRAHGARTVLQGAPASSPASCAALPHSL
jgi:hypothetical protein